MSFMYQKMLGLAFSNPAEFAARIRAIYEVQIERIFVPAPAYDINQPETVLSGLTRAYRDIVGSTDAGSAPEETSISDHDRDLPDSPSISLRHDADPSLTSFLYAVTKMCRPDVVLETGVAHGTSSAAILSALHENGHGVLHSIDLPPFRDGAEQEVGIYIPKSLKDRWHLHRGTSRQIMPQLLPELPPIGLFIHDSLHTQRNIRWELDTITPCLTDRAVIVADDIQDNSAFSSWVETTKPYFHAVAQETGKDSLFGAALLCNGPPS